MSLSFIAFVVSMSITTVANVVFIISTQTMFLAIFGYFYLKEKISLISFFSILLAMGGITIMVGDSLSTGSFFGNIVALAIPINFSILVMIIRKNKNLDMVPAIFYSGIFSIVYGLILSESLAFTNRDILMGFFLGVPQLAFGFICITIGSRTTPSTTIGLLMLTETLFAPIWVWLFLNEIPPLSVLIGGTVIILAIILKSFDRKKLSSN
jgi:drug/metabolite transporter (DMT)-like permease